MNRLLSLVMAVVAIVALAAPVTATPAAIVLEFEKERQADGTYLGTIEGGGTLKMTVLARELIGNTMHFSASLEVDGSSAGSFTGVVRGQINLGTGRAVLNGSVTDGDLDGAQVHEESQLVALSPQTFTGTIRVMPAS